VKLRSAPLPIHALQLIYEHGSYDASNGDRQCERVGFDLAGKRTNHGQAACSIVAEIGQDQSRPAFGLLSANLGIEVEEDDVASIGNVLVYHSTASLPISGPAEISS